ncbi:hypothetical protein HAX54_049242 [Datura stramonium]|uniref:Uncharacterized protein n=1 Tax=Datura stramonium TaxID=4076 RepID=A0ABS8WP25_DATST|nr:hypothetical protein [Datura stramonium]
MDRCSIDRTILRYKNEVGLSDQGLIYEIIEKSHSNISLRSPATTTITPHPPLVGDGGSGGNKGIVDRVKWDYRGQRKIIPLGQWALKVGCRCLRSAECCPCRSAKIGILLAGSDIANTNKEACEHQNIFLPHNWFIVKSQLPAQGLNISDVNLSWADGNFRKNLN